MTVDTEIVCGSVKCAERHSLCDDVSWVASCDVNLCSYHLWHCVHLPARCDDICTISSVTVYQKTLCVRVMTWSDNVSCLTVYFKKAFGRTCYAGLWRVVSSFSVEGGLVQANQAIYKNSSGTALLNSQLGEFFKTTIGVRQGCLPSCSTCSRRRSCRKLSMTTAHLSPLFAGP